jgi:ATP synthase protein I
MPQPTLWTSVQLNLVNSPEPTPTLPEATQLGDLPPEPNSSMEEYYQLQRFLLRVTLILSAIIFIAVWIFYSLNIALNYLIGACTGVVYLRMLAKNVESLGRGKNQIGKNQLGVFVVVIIIASQWNQLQILPIFLGFLTFKAAILVYMFRILSTPQTQG